MLQAFHWADLVSIGLLLYLFSHAVARHLRSSARKTGGKAKESPMATEKMVQLAVMSSSSGPNEEDSEALLAEVQRLREEIRLLKQQVVDERARAKQADTPYGGNA